MKFYDVGDVEMSQKEVEQVFELIDECKEAVYRDWNTSHQGLLDRLTKNAGLITIKNDEVVTSSQIH